MGGAADMTNRGVKSFSKMQQGVGGLVGVYATLAAQVFAVSAAFQFLKSASDVVNLIAGQEALGAVSGVAYKTITASIKEATGGQIAYAEAAKAAAIGTAAGLSPDQLNRLGAAAKNVSHALGRDLTDSFNRLVRGITKAEPELLDELGIILRLDDATKNYADSLGLNANELSVFQKSQAVANEVLTQAEDKFGAINEIMDPSAASLNKFLVSFDDLMNTIKTGAMKSLRPVFDFLAGNTRALTAALSLMAIPIIKSLIPSFEDFGKRANASLQKQQALLKDYRMEIDKTKQAIKLMDRDSAAIGRSSAGVLGSLGKDTTSAAKGSGAAFLLGTSDTKAAQNNARKILDNAQADMKAHNAILTGYLKGATAEQLAILETNYAQRKALLKKHEVEHGNSFKRMGLHVKAYAQEAKATLMQISGAVIGFIGNLGKHLAKLFSVGLWISVAALVLEIFSDWIDGMKPISEESERINDRIEKLEKSNKTLNEELQKTADIKPFLTLTQQVVQLGQAFTSTNIIGKLQELRSLQDAPEPDKTTSEKALRRTYEVISGATVSRDSMAGGVLTQLDSISGNIINLIPLYRDAARGLENYLNKWYQKGSEPHWKESADGTLEILKNLSRLNPELDKFVKLFEEQGYLSKQQTTELDEIQQKWINYGMGVTKAKDALKTFNDELKNLVGKGLMIDPTANLRIAGDKAIELQKAGLTGQGEIIGQTFEQQRVVDTDLAANKQKREKMLQQYGREEGDIPGGPLGMPKGLLDQFPKIKKEWDDINRKVEDGQYTSDQLTETIADHLKIYWEQADALAKTERIQEKFVALSEKLKPIMKLRLSHEKQAARMQTVGITGQQKLQNLSASLFKREAKNLQLLEQKMQAETAYNAAFEEHRDHKTEFTEAELEHAQNALDLAQHNVDLNEISNELAKRKDQILRDQVSIMMRQARVQRTLNSMSERFLELERQRKRESIFTGGGKDKETLAYEQRQRDIARIGGESGLIAQKRIETQEAGIAILDAFLVGDEKAAANAEKKWIAEKNALQVLIDQVEVLENWNKLQVEGLQNEQADVAKALRTRALDPRKQNRQEALAKLDKTATDEEKKNAIAAADATFDLNLQLEETDALYNTIQDSMAGAFADIITGAKNAKEAFAGMAKLMLQELAKIIAKRMMLKALGTLGFRDGGITPVLPGPSFAVGGVARGPRAGYNATLHGNEAVVPLPSGGAIPVQGTMGSTNNVQVNVNVDNSGNASSDSKGGAGMGADLGKVVAKAVQEELQYQKRSGGILNPYGAA